MSQPPLPPGVKVLSESEIQQRLYGSYLGRRQNPNPPASESPETQPVPEQPEWTGSEILGDELKRLRDELITLRKEREDLEKRLSLPIESYYPAKRAGKVWGVLSTFLCIVAVLGGASPFGVQKLQASPVASPYTVQVGVYDVRRPAEKTMLTLQELGYPAFLVESSRRDGKSRYNLYVGQYKTKSDAQRERLRLAADKKFKDAFIRYR